MEDSIARSWWGLYAKAQMIMLDRMDPPEQEMMASLFADIARLLEEEKQKA